MFIAVKSVLHTLLLPPGGPLLVAIAGACLLAVCSRRGARRAGWVLLGGGLAALWLLATPAVAGALSRVAERCPPLDLSRSVDAQAIVILGGALARPETPEYGGADAVAGGLLERITYGAFVAHRTGLPVLVSGADEALPMSASLARDFHIETRWLEQRSLDTFQNAQFSARILKAAGVSRIILVTDAEHEWRAVHEFASAGLAVVPAPTGFWAWHGNGASRYLPSNDALQRSTAALYELSGDWVRRTLAALDLRRQAP